MKNLLITSFILGLTTLHAAHADEQAYGPNGQMMTKILKLVGVPASLVVDLNGVQYNLGNTDCTAVTVAADGLPSYNCVSQTEGLQFADDFTSMILYHALVEAGVAPTPVDANSNKVHVESVSCESNIGDFADCTLITQPPTNE
jgi:hypothetical protein